MKYFIDNLVVSAIKCAESKNAFITASVENCGTEENPEYWYFLRRGNGLATTRCSSTSTRNLLFIVHSMVIGQNIEKWSTKEDFWDSKKM